MEGAGAPGVSTHLTAFDPISCCICLHSDHRYQELHDDLVYCRYPLPYRTRAPRDCRHLPCSVLCLQCLQQCLTQQVSSIY